MRVTDEEIIAALLNSPTNRDAAATIGMNERHFYKRLQSEELRAKLRAVQEKLLDDTVSEMRKNLTEATAVIVSVMKNPEVSPQTRINAADMLQRNYLKLSERADILDRLDRLEEQTDEY